MTTMCQQVARLAEFLDDQGKPEQPIHILGTRATLRKRFKAGKRGGPLLAGKHELVIVPKSKAVTPESLSLFDVVEP